MNFNRNLLTIIAFVGSVFAISGCTSPNSFKEFEFLDPIKDLNQVVDTHEDEDHQTYIKHGNYDDYVANGKNGHQHTLGSSYDVLYKYAGDHIIPSSGSRKILVVPVEFKDFTLDELGVSKDDYISSIEKAFFGVAKNNRYVSVSEYYNRSSYGELQISGKVLNKFFTFPYSVAELSKPDVTANKVSYCYSDIIKWYKENYPGPSLNEYLIDPERPFSGDYAIYAVYTYPTELKTNPNVFWNYTFLDKPFSWSSYSCLNTLAGAPDAHTFIHETGHLLGLPDYYPKNETDADPTGRIDMMDCSVGDHTGFSKMLLNWARPFHVKDSCEIKIRALSNYGDLILISDNWKNTAFEEYYLLEFYTPLGLNSFDSNVGNNKAKLPMMPGVKIYHIDARLGYFETDATHIDTKVFKDYCDSTEGITDPSETKQNVNLAHNNSSEVSASLQPILNLYELQLNNAFGIADECAVDENLFHKGESFEITPSMFNVENSTNYKITVTDVNYKDATVKIEKIETTQN